MALQENKWEEEVKDNQKYYNQEGKETKDLTCGNCKNCQRDGGWCGEWGKYVAMDKDHMIQCPNTSNFIPVD